MATKLHHFAFNITPRSLEFVIELFEQLGCSLSYRKNESRWCLIEQEGLIIQIVETEEKPIPTQTKKNTHIGFVSETPEQDIQKIEAFVQNKDKKITRGSWSNQELWFDLPEIFVNFVVEIMDKKILD